LNVFDLLRFG